MARRKKGFDKEAADLACAFIESLTFGSGDFVGQPFKLLPFQRNIVREIFGRVREDGTRRIRKGFISTSRKQGKTELLAALCVLQLFCGSETSPEIYSASTTREQAALIFKAAKQMILNDPYLRSITSILDSKKQITNLLTNGFYRSLSSDGGAAHGLNPSMVVFDELHAWLKPSSIELYDALTSGSGARRQRLLISITTAGYDTTSICFREYKYAKGVLDGSIKDDTYFAFIAEVPQDADWTDRKLWPLASPALGQTVTMQFLEDEFVKAQSSPYEENKFRRLYLNQWTTAETLFITMDKWDASAGSFTLDELKGRKCFLALDLSTTTDVTAALAVFPFEDGTYKVLSHSFLPGEGLYERSTRDRVPYPQWAMEGLITTTEGNVVDYEAVRQHILKWKEDYQIKEIVLDRWGSQALQTQLTNDGFTVVPHGQGFASMSAPTKEMLSLILQKKLHHNGNPVLRWMNSCTTVAQDPSGNVKVVKPNRLRHASRVDNIVALVMALGRATVSVAPKKSVYEERGILTF